jgi:excisionase family DNA binding protein
MLTVHEAAKRMGVSAAIIYALCTARQLRHSRVGLGRGKIVIAEEAIVEYLRARECGPEDPKPPPVPRSKLRLQHLRLPS